MDSINHNPKRSKALIITVIAVCVLLVGAYFLYTNRAQIFGTKGDSVEDKSFFPLLGSSRKKPVDVINQQETPTQEEEIQTEEGGIPLFKPIPNPVGKQPIVSLSANPQILTDGGGKFKLTWRGDNVTSCIPSWTNKKTTETSGTSNELSLSKSKVFSIACTNGVTTVSAQAGVTVIGGAALDVSIRARPSVLDESGPVVLSWVSNSNAQSCTLGWNNKKVATTGEVTVSVSSPKSFSVSCTNGTLSETAEVDVIITGFRSTLAQCRDGIDNDGDTTIDTLDPSCHTDFDSTDESTYNPNENNEARVKTVTTEDNKCKVVDDNPLVFTATEQKELDTLLRQFYRVAPLLKTEDDVLAETRARIGYIELVREVESLTNRCVAEQYPNTDGGKARLSADATKEYTGPRQVRTNPYYPPIGTTVYDAGTYVSEFDYVTKSQQKIIQKQQQVVAYWNAKIATAKKQSQIRLYTHARDQQVKMLEAVKDSKSMTKHFMLLEKMLGIW
ncbi:MAG: hypothetical protein KBB75_00655 [Candidatus Pacebacteria bacterium]|nr:hypothetical protein [Candidatus Paceibacterota bacterium]